MDVGDTCSLVCSLQDNRELIAAMLEMRQEMKNEIMKLSNRVKNLTDTRSGGAAAPKQLPGFIE